MLFLLDAIDGILGELSVCLEQTLLKVSAASCGQAFNYTNCSIVAFRSGNINPVLRNTCICAEFYYGNIATGACNVSLIAVQEVFCCGLCCVHAALSCILVAVIGMA